MPDAAGLADALAARRPPVVVSSAPGGGAEAQIRETPDALIHRGLCLYAAGKWLEAARAWERYLKVVTAGADAGSVNSLIENAYNREGPDWLVYRGLALFEEGNYGGAERVWLRWLEIAPEDAKQYSVRVWILDARERQRVA
jgi:tetratricopeptide (TPR) repeat protein